LPRTTFVDVDERSARRTLRGQIARLERDLADALLSSVNVVAVPLAAIAGTPGTGGPRLLSLGELERIRDGLHLRLRDARTEIARRGDAEDGYRRLIEQMLLEPKRHKYARVTREQVGERGCGAWEVRPRYGMLGMLCGWWQVKISSGCPLVWGP
jgi:hypothetical protein